MRLYTEILIVMLNLTYGGSDVGVPVYIEPGSSELDVITAASYMLLGVESAQNRFRLFQGFAIYLLFKSFTVCEMMQVAIVLLI